MSPVIRVSDEVYARLEQHAVGFDNPSNVVERLLDFYDKKFSQPEDLTADGVNGLSSSMTTKRVFTNKEIQQRISAAARKLPTQELEQLCDERLSKKLFGISFPLFVRIPSKANQAMKRAAVKSSDGVSRWTWKFGFEKGEYAYAICTQWYAKNDPLVQKWLQAHE